MELTTYQTAKKLRNEINKLREELRHWQSVIVDPAQLTLSYTATFTQQLDVPVSAFVALRANVIANLVQRIDAKKAEFDLL